MTNELLQGALEKVLGKKAQIYGFHQIGGGEVNQFYKALTDYGVYFLKVHESNLYPKLFQRELLGLQTIQKTNTIQVNHAIGICEVGGYDFLVFEYIEPVPLKANYWAILGEQLAQMHHQTNRSFGFVEDNFIGVLPQINHRGGNWGQLYVKNRLIPNVRRAADMMLLDASIILKFEQFFKLVEFAFPEEGPALLHGNLWTENVLVSTDGNPMLSNPSVYFGHREMDLAMTKMVGSFPSAFYKAYHETFPLENDWEIRLEFGQMYYALINLNTYGYPYLNEVKQRLNRWVS